MYLKSISKHNKRFKTHTSKRTISNIYWECLTTFPNGARKTIFVNQLNLVTSKAVSLIFSPHLIFIGVQIIRLTDTVSEIHRIMRS